MLGLGVAALILGYAAVYTGISNLLNGGNGPKYFESLGVKNPLSSPATDRVPNGSGSQVGPPALPNLPSPGIIGGPFKVEPL